jgi:shikimate kinase
LLFACCRLPRQCLPACAADGWIIYGIFGEFTPFRAGHGAVSGSMPRNRSHILHRTIVFVGMMGAGKTAVGGAVARMLGVPFLDSDHEIEQAANMSIPEIFARDRETRVLERLLEGPPVVLSTGGGAFMAEENRRLIAARGLAVWLKADLEVLWARVRHKDSRPLLRGPDPKGTLARLLEARSPVYAQAGLVVEVAPRWTVQQTAAEVVAALIAHPAGVLTVEQAT